MSITFFSVIMSVLFSTKFIIVIHLMRNRPFFLQTFGIHTIIFLYALCIIRMVFIIELPFTQPVKVEFIYNELYQSATSIQFPLSGRELDILDLALIIWVFGAFIQISRFLYESFRVSKKLRNNLSKKMLLADHVLLRVEEESKRTPKVNIIVYGSIGIPVGIGLIHKTICLPDKNYSEQELYYILKHEYAHFCNRDLEIKFLVRLFCCLFWWNPAVYLLKADLSRMLEIKCDNTATENFSKENKLQYLSVIVQSIVESRKLQNTMISDSGTYLFSQEFRGEIIERFELVSKPIQKKANICQVVFVALTIFALTLSYAFVFQSAFSPPVEEVYTDVSVREISPAEWYILKHSDEDYSMVLETGEVFSINKELAEQYISEGIKLREE